MPPRPCASGRLTGAALADLGILASASAYVCGPASFMADIQDALTRLGVNAPSQHRREEGGRHTGCGDHRRYQRCSADCPDWDDGRHPYRFPPAAGDRLGDYQWSASDPEKLALGYTEDFPRRNRASSRTTAPMS